MSNLTGTAWIQRKPSPLEPSPAVNEWSARVGDAMPAPPGEIPKPRNTLRGVPQPWRNRSVEGTLYDEGPLHYSVHRPGGNGSTGSMSGHYLDSGRTTTRTGTINGTVVPQTTSTATLEAGDWEQRTAMLPGPTRGSATPNWRPLTEGQFDMTGTGSCNKGGPWDPLTHTSAIAPFLEDAEREAKAKKSSNSTAAIQRGEWEDRLKEYGTGLTMQLS